ncbi:hypothetical protein ACSBR1_037411 [Camellia fascicularis]
MDSSTSRPAVVVDNGTGYTKMGFAGNVEPCFIVPTVVTVNDSFNNQSRSSAKGSNWLAQHSAGVMADLDFFIGEEGLSRSRSNNTYTLTNPIRNGQIIIFLLTESPLTAPESREYTEEIMFETFNVPGLYIVVQPVLAHATGYTTSKCEMTGVVVDIGDGATHVVPVADGYVIGSSIKSIPFSGKDVTLFIQQLMRKGLRNFWRRIVAIHTGISLLKVVNELSAPY